jgi:hypothetical protein
MNPALFESFAGQFFCALIIGIYLCYSGWKQIKNFPNSLKYSPTDGHKESFNSFIQENNSIVAWGSGKVTDGVCAKAEISERIGKVYQATQTLLESYRQALN